MSDEPTPLPWKKDILCGSVRISASQENVGRRMTQPPRIPRFTCVLEAHRGCSRAEIEANADLILGSVSAIVTAAQRLGVDPLALAEELSGGRIADLVTAAAMANVPEKDSPK